MKIEDALKSEILRDFLNDDYLEIDNLEQIKKTLSKNSPKSIKLEDFFKKEKYGLLKNEIRSLKYKRKYIPDKLSFSIADIGKNFKKLIDSEELRIFLGFLIGKNIKNYMINSKMLKHKDYTLLSDEQGTIKSGCVVNFLFNDLWREEYGGYFSYISENEEVLRVLPTENSVIIVFIDQTIQGFIKYINANSLKKKIYFVDTKIL